MEDKRSREDWEVGREKEVGVGKSWVRQGELES